MSITYNGELEGNIFSFDLFVQRDEFYKIIDWLKENNINCEIRQPLSKIDDKLDESHWENNGENWLWLFILDKEQSLYFRLTWEK